MARAPAAAAAGGGNGGCPAVRQSDCLVGEFFTPEASYRYSGLCPANASVASADACRRLGRLLGGNPDAVMSMCSSKRCVLRKKVPVAPDPAGVKTHCL